GFWFGTTHAHRCIRTAFGRRPYGPCDGRNHRDDHRVPHGNGRTMTAARHAQAEQAADEASFAPPYRDAAVPSPTRGLHAVQLPQVTDIRQVGSRVLRWGSHGFWAVLDQGLFALSNLLVNVLLARSLPSEEYGAFVTAYTILLLVGVVHM